MNSPYSSSDPNKNKAQKWIANHLGTFSQKGSAKDVVNNAFMQLTQQLSDGRFRELQCTIEVNRDSKILYVKRWLDNITLEEFHLSTISNVVCHAEVPQNKTLTNIVTYNTQCTGKDSSNFETHIFHLEDINTANYLASDIRSAVEACLIMNVHNNPIKVLPTKNRDANVKFGHFDSFRQTEDITSKTERNLLLLNYCFDDIEFFLQHLRDQEDAKALMASNKSKSSDRLLDGRAKPSPPSAYITCIQKFKFSFNLLSKLDGKIKDPNSHKLTELLMENLIKIANAYWINHKEKPNKVKEPLLTAETIKMMQLCLPRNYYKIWSSWGEFWIKSRERWTGYQEKYYPEFFNGYQIDIDDLVKEGVISPSIEPKKVARNNSEITQLIHTNQSLSALSLKPSNETGPTNQREEDFCRSVLLRGGRLYKVISTFTASKDQELSMSEGEIIEVVEVRTDRNWWLCANMHGQKGYSPNTYLEQFQYIDRTITTESSIVPPAPPTPTQNPLNNSWNSRKVSSSSLPKDSKSFEKSTEEAKTINEELKKKIHANSSFGNPLGRASFVRPGPVVSKKHGQLSINQDSTNTDVQNWLRFKKFSDEDIEMLKEFTGQTIFLLSREHMNRIIGVDAAARLDSFIKVQKSLSGFGTLSRRELDDILLKRKNQVDFQESF